jgi:hypothetical protein
MFVAADNMFYVGFEVLIGAIRPDDGGSRDI